MISYDLFDVTVLRLVMPYCCLQALVSPHYSDQKRRRSKAPVAIVNVNATMDEPSIDEIKQKLNLPICELLISI